MLHPSSQHYIKVIAKHHALSAHQTSTLVSGGRILYRFPEGFLLSAWWWPLFKIIIIKLLVLFPALAMRLATSARGARGGTLKQARLRGTCWGAYAAPILQRHSSTLTHTHTLRMRAGDDAEPEQKEADGERQRQGSHRGEHDLTDKTHKGPADVSL
jgi:hypothetical protein